jgi:hypothetical protein
MEKGIVASWSLVAFARSHGKMSIAPLINHDTGEAFKSCAFTNGLGDITFVNFSSKLGDLTAGEIVAQKDSLQVVQLESGTYKLCKIGSTWEDVDLGL